MDEHEKKMIAPIVITGFFLICLIVYIGAVIGAAGFNLGFLLLAIPLIALGAGMVYVLITRIREIKGGEEDDLSNY